MGSGKARYQIAYFVFFIAIAHNAVAFDPLDPNGNITIKWDVLFGTPDGYVAGVTINNFQMYRNIMSPGWTLGWTWAKNEIIWSMLGAKATDQGDCSNFTTSTSIPHSCKRTPSIVDLHPGAPYNQQVANCCKGGVLTSQGQAPASATSAFQVSVGRSGYTNTTIRLPKNFTILAPGKGYTCGSAKVVKPTVFLSADGRRMTRAIMTWTVTCTYSAFLASKNSKCCVSMSSFYNSTTTSCPGCACGCPSQHNCQKIDSKGTSFVGARTKAGVQCTRHMCPVQVHWYVKRNYKGYWRAKIAITNLNYRMNYSQWNLVVQHPNFNDIVRVYSFKYKPLHTYMGSDDTVMFYGIKNYNGILSVAGKNGTVQSDIVMKKDTRTFSFKHGWPFPRRVYFNGDNCVMANSA